MRHFRQDGRVAHDQGAVADHDAASRLSINDMPASHPTPDERRIKEASAWFSRLNTRSVSSGTLEGFRTWRQNPLNRDAYAEVERAWRRMGALQGDALINAAIARAPAASRTTTREALLTHWREIAVACTVFSIFAALALSGTFNNWVFGKTYATEIGEQRLVQLSDGSHIRLDTNTKVRVKLTASRRNVELERGQAMFDVAHDVSRPFIVRAASTDIRAVGTTFDVRRDGGRVHVALVTGVVEVSDNQKADHIVTRVAMRSGEQLVADGVIEKPTPLDLTTATSWTDGRILFHAIPLDQAISEMNRYSRRRIILASPGLGGETVSGAFDTTNVDGFIAAVCDLHRFRVQTSHNEIRLLSQKP